MCEERNGLPTDEPLSPLVSPLLLLMSSVAGGVSAAHRAMIGVKHSIEK